MMQRRVSLEPDMMKRHYTVLMRLITQVVAEQVKLNESYENWKRKSTIDAVMTGKKIGCLDCFENAHDKVIEIIEQNKRSVVRYYIHPECLDHYWNDYINNLNMEKRRKDITWQ